ncbi:MAG TPA: hypothetical protein VGO60_01500, partial [Iamia sp.]|nr:hypothetical protein [Iamia sp.]
MTFPGMVLSALYDVASRNRQDQAAAGLTRFRAYLAQQAVIRLFVDGTSGRGHQASSVRVLRKIAGDLQYGGTVELAYRGGPQTLAALQLLIPELHGGLSGVIGNTTVLVVAYPCTGRPVVTVGFTGGADDAQGSPDENFATGLGVGTFLRLQPYDWGGSPDQIQWDSSVWPYLDLRAQTVLGGGSFLRRAYAMPAPPPPPWGTYPPAYATALAVLQWLTKTVATGDLHLCVTTGIRTSAKSEIGPPAEVIFNLVTGLQASQRNGTNRAPGSRSVVVVNLDDMASGARDIAAARQLLDGGIADSDLAWLEQEGTTVRIQPHAAVGAQEVYAAWQTRNQYLRPRRDTSAADRAHLLLQGADLATVQAEVTWLKGTSDRVLFLPIGPVPLPVFDYVFSCATAPTVFEGQSTANLALTLGNPYFHVRRRAKQGAGGSQYPSTTLGAANFDT